MRIGTPSSHGMAFHNVISSTSQSGKIYTCSSSSLLSSAALATENAAQARALRCLSPLSVGGVAKILTAGAVADEPCDSCATRAAWRERCARGACAPDCGAVVPARDGGGTVEDEPDGAVAGLYAAVAAVAHNSGDDAAALIARPAGDLESMIVALIVAL